MTQCLHGACRCLWRRRELWVPLQHAQSAIGEQARIELRLLVRQSANGEFSNQVIKSGQGAEIFDFAECNPPVCRRSGC
jgi:hypothetical protein